MKDFFCSLAIVSQHLTWKNKGQFGRTPNWFVPVALCFVLGITAGVTPAQIVPITIVSVGDSYASGEGAPDLAGTGVPLPRWRGDNRDGAAVTCHRSNNAAPAMAARLIASIRPATFFHFACSGAVISDVTGGQLATAARIVGGPIDALIISVGGNDVNFAEVVGSCLALPCELFGPAAFPGPVFALTFPPGTPNIPGSGFDGLDFTKAETAAATVIQPLNATLAITVATAAAVSPGGPVWHFVTGISSAFDTHGYCMGLPNPAPQMWVTGRMVNTFADSEIIQGDERGTMHPNASGQGAASAAIATAIMASVPIVTAPSTAPPPPTPCKTKDVISCAGFCDRHPSDVRCRKTSDECLNRHLPGCKD